MSHPVWLTHLRLALRSWGLWLVLACGVALTVVATSGGPVSRMFMNFNELAAPFFYLLQMLITAAAAQRERSERVDELVESLPYEASGWILGRYLVYYLIWLTASVLLWATGGLMVLLADQPLDLANLVLNWAVVAPITLAFTTAISLMLGSLMRPGTLTYFATAGAWLAGPFSQILASKENGSMMVPVAEYFASGRAFPLGAEGYFYNTGLLAANRLFALGVTGLALATVIYLAARRRGRPTRPVLAALLLAGLLTTGSATGAAAIWNGRYAAISAEMAGIPKGWPPEERLTLAADNYDLAVTFTPESHGLAAQGSFDLTNTGSQPLEMVDLTLRQNLKLTRLQADGKDLAIRRRGDHITANLSLAPGESRRLTAAWEGEVWQWRLRDGPKLAAHVAPESIFLPAHYGWYPLPGRQYLTIRIEHCYPTGCDDGLTDFSLALPPTSFDLAVSGTDLPIIHNGEDGAVPGLYLLGSPFPIEEQHGLLVAVSPYNRVQGERMARELSGMLAAYEQMIPRMQGPVRLMESHDALYFGSPWAPTSSEGATPNGLMVHGVEVGRYRPGFFETDYDMAVWGLWWPDNSRGFSQSHLYNSFGLYMEYARSGNLPIRGMGAMNVLLALEEAKGRESVIQLLREMHALLPAGGPSISDFEAAASRLGGGDPAVAEALQGLKEGR